MADVIIRPINKDDAEAFFALRLEALQTNPEAFGSTYEETFSSWTAETYATSRIPDVGADKVIFVAEVAGDLVGMMGFIPATRLKTKHSGDIWGVYVRPSMRGRQIGKKLIQAVLDHAQQCDGLNLINLSVVTENQAAIKLYESVGFKAWGTQPDAMRDANNKSYDMLWMSYQIK